LDGTPNFAVRQRKKKRFRAYDIAAVAQRIDEVRAAIPLGALFDMGFQSACRS